MKVSPLRVAILASLVASGLLSNQALAQSKKQAAAQSNNETQALITELKAELEHQKQIAAEQQERLEALESKLNATLDVQTAMAENDAKEKKDAPKLKLGEGISVTNDKDEVKLYGLIDLTVRSRSNADKKGNSLRDITSGYLSGSRWGIQGSHKLPYDNNSMKAIYKLESEYNMRDGSMDTANVLFNRDAWIGLESDTLGRVTIGRQNTLGRDFAEAYGIPFAKPQLELTEGGWSNNNVSKNGIYYVGAATGTRYDGGIVWKRKFGNFIGGVAYQLGGEVGKFSHNTSDAVALAYNGESFTLSGEYNESKISNLHHRTYTVGGNYRFTPEFRINAGYYHYEAEQNKVGKRKDDNYVLSASYSPDGSKFNYYLSWEGAKANNAGYASTGYTLLPYKDTSGVIKAGTGNRDAYAATVIYKVDKRLDFYAFSDYMKTRGGYRDSVTNGYHGTVEIGGGMRLRF